MKPTPRETKKIHENYEKVKQHLIDEKYAVDADSADKIISGMSQDWFDTIVGWKHFNNLWRINLIILS